MAKKACQCKKAEECEECPEWIFTFADLVMLMMGFFVILWVLKPNPGKTGASDAQAQTADENWKITVGEIRKGFGWEPDPQSNDPIDKIVLQRAMGRKEGDENDRIRENPPGADHNPSSIRPGDQAVVGGRLAFDAGSAQLTPEARKILDEIAEKIRGHNAIVQVKGHTSLDDVPADATAEQKMNLSIRRATAAVDYLIADGISPDVLRVQGCSTFEPVRQRTFNSSALADNRRVEVEWTSQLVEERQDPANIPAVPTTEPIQKLAPAAP